MKKYYIIITFLYLIIYILPLNFRPIIIPDESRYGEIPREMIESGDFIVPKMNDIRYFEKPALGYIINAASILFFGENPFSIRFPSALSVGLSAIFIFILVNKFYGNLKTAIFSVLIFLTCFEVFGVGCFSVLDSLLAFFLTSTMFFFFFAYIEKELNKKILFLILSGIFSGLAFLTKGFLAFVVPVIVIAPFLIWELYLIKKIKNFINLIFIPTISAIIISLPWSIMIHLREGDFWNYFFWIEHIKRFMAKDAQHAQPLWLFIPIFFAGGMPWTFIFPSAISGIKKIGFKEPLIRFSLCAFLFPFLFFSASKGKLPTYILPCFPPFSILFAIGILKYLEDGNIKSYKRGSLFFIVFALSIAFFLIFNQITGLPKIEDFDSGHIYNFAELWKLLFCVTGLIVWSYLLYLSQKKKNLIYFCISPLLFMLSAHFIIPEQTLTIKAPGEFLLKNKSKITPDTIIISYSDEPVKAICWFYKRKDVYLVNYAGELEYGFNYKDAKNRLLTNEQFQKMVHNPPYGKPVAFISEIRFYEDNIKSLPKPKYEDKNSKFAFAIFKIKESKLN